MMGQSRKNERNSAVLLDIFYLVTGILIVILALLSFINPQGNEMLFPLVFFLAALLNCVGGVCEIRAQNRSKKMLKAGVGHLVVAAVLTVLGILSGISIWG